MTTLASATLDVARLLINVIEGTASSGSTTTLVDNAIWSTYANDHFNQGTIWFLSGNNIGKSAIITDFAFSGTTGTFTFATQSAVCAANDLYAASTQDYPRWLLRQAVNAALQTIPNVLADYEDATYITVSDQMSYDLPAGVYNVKQVWVGTNTTSPYDYYRHYGWQEIEDDLRFDPDTQPTVAGYRIKLVYSVPPAALTTDAGSISSYIHIDRLKWTAAVHCLQWRMGFDESKMIREKYAIAEVKAREMAIRYPVQDTPRDPRLPHWGVASRTKTEFDGIARY